MLAPYLLGVFVLVGVPAAVSLGLAFFQYDAISAPLWVGLQNFRDLLREPLFTTSIKNSLFFVALAVPLRLLGALGLALLYNRPRPGSGVYRLAAYLPTVIPEPAYALIWLWLLNPVYGPINQLLGLLGVDGPAWLVEAGTARLALVGMTLFQIGEGFVVLLAALRSLPPGALDAARVDGASQGQVLRWITLPLMVPWLLVLTFRDLMLSFQHTFTPAYLMTGGGPYYATFYFPLLIYEEAFDRFRFGTGAAMMMLLFAVTLALLLLLYWLMRRWGDND